MIKPLLRLSFGLAASTLAYAHFVFVVPQPNGANANIFISETLERDSQVDVGLVKDSKLNLRNGDGKDSPLTLVKSGNVYSVSLSGSDVRLIHGVTDIGLSGKPDKQFILLYHPKTILGNAFDAKATLGSAVPVELIPQGRPGAMTLKLVARGKALADAEIVVIQPNGKEKKVKTDSAGQTEVLTQTGRYGAWARFWESTPGQRDGKKYGEVHHYATLVFDASNVVSASGTPAGSALFATMPQPSASFGSVVSDGWLYVYGGHVSPTHNYFAEAVSGRFDRLRLTGEPVWEELPAGPGMQGMNLAEHKGLIYRVGGMVPLNKKGEPSDNHSTAEVARFDPKTKKWEPLAPMPEGRSSHDVAVIGDKLYVAGGWNMLGKTQTWADTMFVLDLAAPTPTWSSIPQHFKRRALMTAALDGKLYVVGGISDTNKVGSTVSIYDPLTKTWSEGPPLPEGPVLGFAPAAGLHQGSLYVSIADGTLLRLNQTENKWENAGKFTARVAHRLASRGDTILVIGGANGGKNSDLIEAVTVSR